MGLLGHGFNLGLVNCFGCLMFMLAQGLAFAHSYGLVTMTSTIDHFRFPFLMIIDSIFLGTANGSIRNGRAPPRVPQQSVRPARQDAVNSNGRNEV